MPILRINWISKAFTGLLLFSSFLSAAEYAFFTPPKKWEIVDPKALSPRVKMGFVGSTRKELRPSLNLAVEEVALDTNEYVAAVRKVHESNPNNRWRDLGKFSTPAGDARLTEIESKKEGANVRLLQLILVKKGTAYIITASALKEEFSLFYEDFKSAFRSFEVTSDLIGAVPDPSQREMLKKLCTGLKETSRTKTPEAFQKEDWISFQNVILQNFSNMGAFWQVLMLQSQQQNLKQDTNL